MTQEEYFKLCKKYLDGQCSKEEEELLESYSANSSFKDDVSEADAILHKDIYSDLSERINCYLKQRTKKTAGIKFLWLRVAASLLIVGTLGLVIYNVTQTHSPRNYVSKPVSKKTEATAPLLKLPNGKELQLDSASKNAALSYQTGVDSVSGGYIKYRKQLAPNAETLVYHTITTPVGKQYQVELSDGSRVWLNAQSSIKFPVAFSKQNRDVTITGECYFEVAKNKEAPFSVLANGTVVRVLGTHFNVSAYPEDKLVQTTLLEGAVQLANGESKLNLKPGEVGIANLNNKSLKSREADVTDAMAWKNGLFIFKDENIQNVMKIAGRWYGVDVKIADEVKQKSFYGTISRKRSLEDFMQLLKLTEGINYTIKEGSVIVMK
ncbi:FecR family protein [uncultured Mucilaginibacter sp.]|uniref:FecR family protein n=1 Tax=uncultured Mucilaginibacter sp. TaxID=797541 RepID=UPI0025FF2DD2|nr:FecR family protein [uncultured Mucilaginibacter sp.]